MPTIHPLRRAVEIFSVVLVAIAFGLAQVLIGGTRLLFALPSYALLATVGVLTLLWFRTEKPPPSRTCLISSIIFFGYILWRAFLSPVEYVARPDIYSVLAALIVYFFVACFCTSPKQRMSILVILLTLSLAHVLIGAIQFRDGNNFMLIPFLQRFDYGRRASGFYVCPNHLAGLLEVIAVFGLSMVCWSRWPMWAKLLIGYAVAVCYVGLVLTASRGGYLSVSASLIAFGALSLVILYRAGARLFWRIGGISLVAAITVGAIAVFLVHKSDYLSGRAQTVFEKTNIRLDLWQGAIAEWKLSPLVGTGSGTYLYYGRMFRTERMQRDPTYVHNDYLHLLAEYGLIGTAFFVLFLTAHLYNGWKNFQRLGPKRVIVAHRLLSNGLALNIGAIAAVAAYMVHSFLDFNLHIPANALLMAFVFGLLANAGTKQEGADRSMSIFWRLPLPVLGLWVAFQCTRLFPGEYFTERARTAQRDNHPDEAIAFASRGLATEKANPYLYKYLASAQFTRCDAISDFRARVSCYEQPIENLNKARTLAPQDATLALQLAFTYDLMERFAESEWLFYEAMRWDPRSIYLKEAYDLHLSQWQAAAKTNQP
jgi:O-antigen ligase